MVMVFRFDTSNGRRIDDQKKMLCGLGAHEEEQLRVLDDMKQVISTMRVGRHKSLVPFQKGILTSVEAIKGLYFELKAEGQRYLLTSRLNSDSVENLFSCIRGMGVSYDHPGPVEVHEFLFHLRIIGKNLFFLCQDIRNQGNFSLNLI